MINESPLVSVVLPCYEAEIYVEQAVRSVMQQTYSNLEIIIIDDCSPDNTYSILQMLAKEDSRIKLFHNETNLKLVATLNKGISFASGKYIARMDADDISLPERIQLQVTYMENNPTVALCGGNCIKIDREGNTTGKIKYPTKSDELKAELLFFCPFAHPAVFIRKEVLNKINTYTEGMVPAEDYELWLSIAEKYDIANLPSYLLQYRWHGANISVRQKDEQSKALYEILHMHKNCFGFANEYLHLHLKFLEGTWYKKSSIADITVFNDWRKSLLKKNKSLELFDKRALNHVFDKYMSLALLSILKSKENNFKVKSTAAAALLTINPFATLANIASKL